MVKVMLPLLTGILTLLGCDAFYKAKFPPNMPMYIPKNINEVKKFLCGKIQGDQCLDNKPAKIIINRLFDFTNSEGAKTETGCFHATQPAQCLKSGQLKLNVCNQCQGLKPTQVSYSVAGRVGMNVGSNKIIIGQRGGGFKGKGLRLKKVENVEIRNLKIININPHVIWGGDAIDLFNSNNVLIHGNYLKDIGRQMIVTHFGSNTGITISNNVFDGRTDTSSMCDGTHYWLWLFLGEADRITLQNNVIFNTSGRGPHLVSQRNTKAILHFIQNIFYDVRGLGLIDLDDNQSVMLLEGNIFYNVKEIVHKNSGHILMVRSQAEQRYCKRLIGRMCLVNQIVSSGGLNFKNDLKVVNEFRTLRQNMVRPIQMKRSKTGWVKLPPNVDKLVT